MSQKLTERKIQQMCGPAAFRKGEAYRRAGKVSLSLTETGADRTVYEAFVKDHGQCLVRIELDAGGEVAAACACSVHFSYDKYCKHVAAALLSILVAERPSDGESEWTAAAIVEAEPDAGDKMEGRIASRLLDVFRPRSRESSGTRAAMFESRLELEAELIVAPYRSGPRRNLLGVELRVGPGPTYAVPDIREFIGRYERGEEYAFSRHFAYDPSRHCFSVPDDAAMAALAKVARHERLQRRAAGALYAGEAGDTRTLPIPPFAWEETEPKLAAAPLAKLQVDDRLYDGIRVTDEPLPLRFAFDEAAEGGYRLFMNGIRDLLILDAYGLAVDGGRLVRLDPEACSRLLELQKATAAADSEAVPIPAGQIEPFLERVVPGLRRLGEVRVSRAISDRVVQTPLQARVYLDRIRDRLLVGLEFQYGDIVVNPLEDEASRRGENRILIREGEREARILGLLENAAFAKTEGGFYMQDEEREFDFLHHVVPELEKLARIYATSAVKERLFAGGTPPVVSVELDERTNWLEFTFRMDGIPEDELRRIIQSLADKRKYHRLPDGALMPLETEAFREVVRVLNEFGLPESRSLQGPRFRIPIGRGLALLDSHDRDGLGVVRLGKTIRRLLADLRHPEDLDFPVPDGLEAKLRDYQRYGYQWLRTLAHYRFGGILADDMGLGKTVQTIAYLVSALPEIRAGGRPALIVSPASLLYNWQGELERFAPGIRAVVADGSPKKRGAALAQAEQADAIIVSYPLLRRDIARYAEKSWHTLILDEAQVVKNASTQTARAVTALNAEFRFALTGTPIENSLDELRSIFGAVFPGLYPGKKEFAELSRETIARRARPFVLRRLKSDVLGELPEKIESTQVSELLPAQKKLYAAYLAKLRLETLKHLDKEDFGRSKLRFLAGLTRLRQICCHPALFSEGYAGGSAKLEQLLGTIADSRAAGRRMLVFSQFTEMLGIIARRLGEDGVPFFYLDGSTPAAERVELCDRFNNGERDVFLISLKAGGTGLNLTGADTVALYDLWWNPAVERQAEDRAHRIGQKKVVQVLRFVSRGTIEEKMLELQRKKHALIEEVIRPGDEAPPSLTEEDIRELLATE